jgi:hypothetical protein
MIINEPGQWRLQCREIGLDPIEVKKVLSRYEMYKTYTDEHGDSTLDLPRWYKWYRVEKLSEGHAMLIPPEQGCSIGADTKEPPNQDTQQIIGEADFLCLLEACRVASPKN